MKNNEFSPYLKWAKQTVSKVSRDYIFGSIVKWFSFKSYNIQSQARNRLEDFLFVKVNEKGQHKLPKEAWQRTSVFVCQKESIVWGGAREHTSLVDESFTHVGVNTCKYT